MGAGVWGMGALAGTTSGSGQEGSSSGSGGRGGRSSSQGGVSSTAGLTGACTGAAAATGRCAAGADGALWTGCAWTGTPLASCSSSRATLADRPAKDSSSPSSLSRMRHSSASVRRLTLRLSSGSVSCKVFKICSSRWAVNCSPRARMVDSSYPPVSRAAPPRGAVLRSSRSRARPDSSESTEPTSFPLRYRRDRVSNAAAVSRWASWPMSLAVSRLPARPRVSRISCSSTRCPPPAHWSSRDKASRRPPSARRESSAAPSSVRSMPSCWAT